MHALCAQTLKPDCRRSKYGSRQLADCKPSPPRLFVELPPGVRESVRAISAPNRWGGIVRSLLRRPGSEAGFPSRSGYLERPKGNSVLLSQLNPKPQRKERSREMETTTCDGIPFVLESASWKADRPDRDRLTDVRIFRAPPCRFKGWRR
jgi:hypothetical protein